MADRNIRDFLHNSLLKGELSSILFQPPRHPEFDCTKSIAMYMIE